MVVQAGGSSLATALAVGVVVAVLPAAAYRAVTRAFLRWGDGVWERLGSGRWQAVISAAAVGAGVLGAAGLAWNGTTAAAAVATAGLTFAVVPAVVVASGRADVESVARLTVAVPTGAAAALVVLAVGVSDPLQAAMWTAAAAGPAVAAFVPLPIGVAVGRGDTRTARRAVTLGTAAVLAGVGGALWAVATGPVFQFGTDWVLGSLSLDVLGVALATLLVGWFPYLLGRSLAGSGGEDADDETGIDGGAAATVRRS